jgi:hypothetical protein
MRTLCTLLIYLLIAGAIHAQVEIPKEILRVAQYDDALKQGVDQKKPLALVMFDEESITDAAVPVVEDAFNLVKGWTIVVFVSLNKGHYEVGDLAPPFIAAYMETGDIKVPKIILASPREDIAWKVIGPSARRIKKGELKKEIKKQTSDVMPQITNYFAAKAPPALQPPGDKLIYWGLAKSTYALKKFARVEGETLHTLNKDDVESAYELSELKAASARYAKALAALTDAPPAPAPESKPGPEKWTNSKGREIEATFVKLEEGKVTLRLTSGKEHSLALSELSESSQGRARDLSAGQEK